jgi:hypothetical protein
MQNVPRPCTLALLTIVDSPCNGRKKALLIGINYLGQRGQLRGINHPAIDDKDASTMSGI